MSDMEDQEMIAGSNIKMQINMNIMQHDAGANSDDELN